MTWKARYYYLENGRFIEHGKDINFEPIPMTDPSTIRHSTESQETGELGEGLILYNLFEKNELKDLVTKRMNEKFEVSFLKENELKKDGLRVDDIKLETESGGEFILEVKSSKSPEQYFSQAREKGLKQIYESVKENENIKGAFLCEVNIRDGQVNIYEMKRDDILKYGEASEFAENLSKEISEINANQESDKLSETQEDIKGKDLQKEYSKDYDDYFEGGYM